MSKYYDVNDSHLYTEVSVEGIKALKQFIDVIENATMYTNVKQVEEDFIVHLRELADAIESQQEEDE